MKRLLVILALAGPSWSMPVVADLIPHDATVHQRTLTRTAHAHWGIDAPVATFAAQIHQESRWQVGARSPVGAEGLAQFMPATSEWFSRINPRI